MTIERRFISPSCERARISGALLITGANGRFTVRCAVPNISPDFYCRYLFSASNDTMRPLEAGYPDAQSNTNRDKNNEKTTIIKNIFYRCAITEFNGLILTYSNQNNELHSWLR
jgi:hypothetical protein